MPGPLDCMPEPHGCQFDLEHSGFSEIAESVRLCRMNASRAPDPGIAESVRGRSKRPELQLDNSKMIAEKPW